MAKKKAHTVTEVVAERVRHYRERAGMRQEDLAKRTDELGHPLNRVSLARIEAGGTRADNISLIDVLVLAQALDVAPVQLFLPIGDDEWVSITSKMNLHPHLALEWVCGDDEGSGVAADAVRWDENTWPIKMHRGLRERQEAAHRAGSALARAVAMHVLDESGDRQVTVNMAETHTGSHLVDEAQRLFDLALRRLDEWLGYMRGAMPSVPDMGREWQLRMDYLRARDEATNDGQHR